MLELIDRLRALLDDMPNDLRTRGCHDLLLAMEERVGTLAYNIRHPTLLGEVGKLDLLERA